MWDYGHRFCTKGFEGGCITHDYGVEVGFDQYSRTRHCDRILIIGMLGYVGKIHDIIQVELSYL